MSIDPTLPLLMAQQMGPNARVVLDVANHPEIAQNMSRVMTAAELREQAQQVADVSDSAQSSAVDDETGGKKQQFSSRRRRKALLEEEQPEEIATSSPSSEGPFLGNLLNRKV